MFLIIIKCLLKVAWSDFGPLYILLNIIFIFVISYLYFSYKSIILKGSSIICNSKIRLFFSKIEIFEVNKYHLCWVSQKKNPNKTMRMRHLWKSFDCVPLLLRLIKPEGFASISHTCKRFVKNCIHGSIFYLPTLYCIFNLT